MAPRRSKVQTLVEYGARKVGKSRHEKLLIKDIDQNAARLWMIRPMTEPLRVNPQPENKSLDHKNMSAWPSRARAKQPAARCSVIDSDETATHLTASKQQQTC